MDWKQQVEEIGQQTAHVPQIKPEDVPDIDLYMDQLLTFLDQRLGAISRDEETPFVTNTMVNNYTKAKLIPIAVHKRYQRRHVLDLSMVGQLKKVLSMQDLGRIVTAARQSGKEDTLYHFFLAAQERAMGSSRELLREAANHCEEAALIDSTALAAIAVQLAAEAQCRTLLAERILDAIEPPKIEESRKKNRA